MNQFGMQMPGGRPKHTPTMDVYTGLLFLAVVALGLACAVLWVQGSKIGPEGSPTALHEAGQTVKLEPAKN